MLCRPCLSGRLGGGTDITAGADPAAQKEQLPPDTGAPETSEMESTVSGNETAALQSVEPRAVSSGTLGEPDADGNTLTWSFDDSTGTLTITGAGKIDGGDGLRSEPFESMEIKKVRFWNCKVSGSMAYTFGVSGTNATNNISSVEEIDLSGLDTSNVTSMRGMFANCRNLTQLDLSNLDTAGVTDMAFMFSYCNNITSLDLSTFDTANVTDMSGMFNSCHKLTALDLSNFNTANVTDMSAIFNTCSNMTALDISNFNTGNVTNMFSMFAECAGLTELNVSNFDTANVTDMSGMFNYCSSLTDLDLGSFDTSNVTDMSGMFNCCDNLKNLNVSSFDGSKVISTHAMFYRCSSLTALDLGNFNASGLTDMSGMFNRCGVNTLDLSGFHTENVTTMRWLFSGCNNLTAVDLSGIHTENVTDMAYMFYGCENLMKLDLSSFDVTNVSDTELIFVNCSNLSEIKTPAGIGAEQSISLPGYYYVTDEYENDRECKAVSSIDAMCSGKTLVKGVTVENAVLYIPYEYCFGSEKEEMQTYRILGGSLPAGMQLQQNGGISGIPMETGRFQFSVAKSANLNDDRSRGIAEEQKVYSLTVLDNTKANAEAATDVGYEIVERVPDFSRDTISDHTLVSIGDYSEFKNVYIDGVKLTAGTDYTAEPGSTRVTIQSETLTRFSQPGTHTIVIEFRTSNENSLKRAVQNYYVFEEEDGSGEDAEEGGNSAVNGQAVSSGPAAVIDYIVQPGDTLWRIAAKYLGNGNRWRRIYEDNADVLQNPNRLRVGQHIRIYLTPGNGTAGASATTGTPGVPGDRYIVQQGDNLWKIAKKVYGQSWRWGEIYEANRNVLTDPARIYKGQVIVIP